MSKTNFEKVTFWKPDKLLGVAKRYQGVFYDRVTKKGKDYRNQNFRRYSKPYLKLLGKDFRKESGGRYKGYEGMSLNTSGAKISRKLFDLRGITMNNFLTNTPKVTKDSFTLSFTGEAAAIVDGNKKKGRDIISDIPNKEKAWITKELGKLVDIEFKKIPNVIKL